MNQDEIILENEDQKRIDISPGVVIDDRYQIIKRIGKGGAGVVFQVKHLGLGVNLALKILAPDHELGSLEEFLGTFKAEIDHLARLTHRNVIKIIDYGSYSINKKRTYPYYVMEFSNGGDLSAAIEKVSSIEQVIDLFSQVFVGLEYIHGSGMMHGDIKPSNILVHEPGGAQAFPVLIFT